MDELIPVTLRNNHTWRTDHRPFELVDIIDALTRQGFRIANRGAFMELSLDMASRRRDGTTLNLAKKDRVETMRKINRGLSMELAVSRLQTWFGGPQQVQSFCTVSRKGLPKNFAPSGTPDIQVAPGRARPSFQVVCEVSANRGMSDEDYLGQLQGALEHCKDKHAPAGVNVTYGFVLNLRNIGAEKPLQKLYRDFVAKRKKTKENPDGLRLKGPIRIVPMWAPEFGTVIRDLYPDHGLSFKSRAFARALDRIHVKMWSESPPESEDWMATSMTHTLMEGMEGSLYDHGGMKDGSE